MADKKTTRGDGAQAAIGQIGLRLNPPAAEETGARYAESWLRVEFAEGKMTVRLFGRAVYDAPTGETDAAGNPKSVARDLVHHVDLVDDGLLPLRAALEQIIADYEPVIKGDVVQAAYTARQAAQQIDRPGASKGN